MYTGKKDNAPCIISLFMFICATCSHAVAVVLLLIPRVVFVVSNHLVPPCLLLPPLVYRSFVRWPQIPPEFAHDVHGHGLNDPHQGDGGNGVNGAASRAAPRGRKSEGGRPNPGGMGGVMVGGGGHERSSSVGRSGSGSLAPAAAAAAAAVAAAAAGVNGVSRGVLIGKGIGGPGRRPGHDQGHVRSGSGPLMMGHGGGGGSGQMLGLVGGDMAMDTDWDGARGPLPSLDMVTGGLRKLNGRHGNGGGQGGGAEVRKDEG